MKILRIFAFVLGAVWFFPVSCSTGVVAGTLAASYMDSRDIEKGQKPHRPFFVVVHNGKRDNPFSVIPLEELEESKASFRDKTFLMPRPSGQLKTGPRTKCSYRVVHDAGTEQTIEVAWSDDDKTIWSLYRASRSGVVPVYSRMYYHGYMFQALPFAFVFALAVLVVGRLLRRKVSRIGEEGRIALD